MTMDEISGILLIVVACLVVLATAGITIADYRSSRRSGGIEVMEVLEGFSVLIVYGIFAWIVLVTIASVIYHYATQ